MSSVSKAVEIQSNAEEIQLNAEERELLEKAITKCKEIAHQCDVKGMFACKESVFECLSGDFDSNNGKLSACIDIEE